MVWKLDRLSRSLKDLLAIMERIKVKHAGFRSLTEAIDTTIPTGRMMMQMVGAFAEFERAMIGENPGRPVGGRAESRIGGRRRKFNSVQQADIIDNVLSGRKNAAPMARLYNVSEATVSRLMAVHRQAVLPR